MTAKKYGFHDQCDRFRRAGGEADWQEMMSNAKPVSLAAFESQSDCELMLDEGETLAEFLEGSSDPDAGCYVSEIRGHRVLFVQSAGFEFIFTAGGKPLPDHSLAANRPGHDGPGSG